MDISMCDWAASFGGALIGAMIGGVVTWAVARYYYVQASKELRSESDHLVTVTSLIHQGLEEAGLAKFTRDHDGNIVGMKYHIAGSTKIKLTPESGMSYRESD